MEELNIKKWKFFNINNVFDYFEDGKCNKVSIYENGQYWYLAAKKNNNCYEKQIDAPVKFLSKGNSIVFICDGEGSIGYSNYIPRGEYIGTVNLKFAYSKYLNEDNGLFLVTILDKERYKYSFGRKYKKNIPDMKIKLPAKANGDIDWDFMTSYIQKIKKNIRFNSIITKNVRNKSLSISNNWQKYKISDLFVIKSYGSISATDIENKGNGEYPYITRTEQNNGISGFYEYKTAPKNVLTIETTLSGLCFYHDYEFSTGDHIMVLTPKEGVRLNKYTALFIKTIWRKNSYKYDYNRPAIKDNIVKTSLILPTKDNRPDWDYMVNYIKSIPYGDLI